MKVLCIFIIMVVTIQANYHQKIGIPRTARIKAYEDKLFADEPEMESRLWGASVPEPSAHPYVASVIIPMGLEASSCGASIVKVDRVVTAGYCLLGTWGRVDVRVGSPYLYYGGTQYQCHNFSMHPAYNHEESPNNNIGIIDLPQALELSATVKVISIPWVHGHDDYAEVIGRTGTTFGWGMHNSTDHIYYDLQLRETSLEIVDDKACIDKFGHPELLGNIICADGGANNRSICDGDQGGPLVIVNKKNGRKILVGVAAFSEERCDTGHLSVFTRVQSYYHFIKDL